jgi:hypothetical protein
MSGKVGWVSLGLATVEFLPEIQISHLIACKKYDEKITTILMMTSLVGKEDQISSKFTKIKE